MNPVAVAEPPISTQPIDYLHTLHEALSHRQEEVPYAYLMGVSGEAFRFLYNRSDPEAGMNTFFHNPLRATCRALGYKHEILHDDTYQAASTRLQESIRAGNPALIPFEDSCPFLREDTRPETLICQNGYRYELNTKDLHKKWQPASGFLELGPQGYYQFVIGEREREPKPREVALGALRGASKLMRTRQRVGGCAMGLAAYDELAVHLKCMVARKKKVTEQEVHKIAKWNEQPIAQAIETRRAAVEYLKMVRGHLEDEELEHLDKAIAVYQKVAALLKDLQELLPSPSDLDSPAERKPKFQLSLGLFRIWASMTLNRQAKGQPDIIKKFKPKCRAAIKLVEKIARAEKKAITEIDSVIQLSEKMKM